MNRMEARFAGSQGNFQLQVEFHIPPRGVTALFGPSGCGKTTILRCLAGLTRLPGRLVVGEEIWQDEQIFVPPHRRALGYVFQEANLFPHLSVLRNLQYGYQRSPATSPTLPWDEVIELLGLARLLERSPRRLSGGERQRVAIGRALLSQPEVLLMDEPLASLDRFSKAEILPYLQRLHAELSLPMIYVSHDLQEVEQLADQMILLQQGQIVAQGELSQLLADPGLPLSHLPQAAVILEGTVQQWDDRYGLTELKVEGGTLRLPQKLGILGSRHRLRIQATEVGIGKGREDIHASFLNALPARIVGFEVYGEAQLTVFLRLGERGEGAQVLCRITRKSWDHLQLKSGEEVQALVKSVALAGVPTPPQLR